MTSKNTVTVNVYDVFLPAFSSTFVAHYGLSSVFVRALADYFTSRLARIYEKNGKLERPESIARHSTAQAVQLLEQWFPTVDGAHKTAMQEALGELPIGSTALIVDQAFGDGQFEKWLEWLGDSESQTSSR
jgi:hypothetical protein